ncbi:MAG: High-affnity carbon uptake protein Hat/HatR, partial [Cyclobacteriaceae bacterium]
MKERYRDKDILDSPVRAENPFPGLRPFTVNESHLFFGREGQSDEVLLKLSEHRFTAVIGASGTGKSSLMYCGLIPILHGGFMTEAGSRWQVIVTRPGISPIDNLAKSIMEHDPCFDDEQEDRELGTVVNSTILRSSSLGLVDAVSKIRQGPNQNILLLVDQFEELLRYRKLYKDINAVNESTAYVNLLLEAIYQTEVPVYV